MIIVIYITTQEFNQLTAENFVVRLAQAKLPTKTDIADFSHKLENLNRKVTSNKTKHAEAEKKITDLTNEVAPITEFSSFCPNLSFSILNSNTKVTNCILTRKSSEKIKLFDTNLELAMANLTNGIVISKCNNSVSAQKKISLLYGNSFLSL